MARRGSALPKILGGIAFFVVAVIVIALVATSGPADAVTAHMTALAKGDDAAAYALTSSGFRSETSAAQFAAFVAANPILRTGTLSIGEREVSGDAATVTAELTAPDGTKRTLDFQLVKESGDWKIAAYRVRALGSQPGPAAASSGAAATGAAAAVAPAPPAAGSVPCSSTAAQAPDPAPVTAAAPRLRVRLQAGPFGSVTSSSLPNTTTRSFSMAALKAYQGETVYLMGDAPSAADFPNSNFALEICSASNTTDRREGNVRSIKGFPIQTIAGPTSSYVTDISRWTLPEAPGAYRVDAYVWLEKTNTWHLVARMSVTLTP